MIFEDGKSSAVDRPRQILADIMLRRPDVQPKLGYPIAALDVANMESFLGGSEARHCTVREGIFYQLRIAAVPVISTARGNHYPELKQFPLSYLGFPRVSELPYSCDRQRTACWPVLIS